MTVQQSNPYVDSPRPWVEDEVDLRQLLQTFVDWWREIVLFTLLAAGIAVAAVLVWNFLQPPVYTAAADVVLARMRSEVELDERFLTTAESQQPTSDAWRGSLLLLAKSGAIAEAVIAELGDQLDPAYRTPSALAELVKPEIPQGDSGPPASDIIRITVKHGDPAQAALIANTWARHFVSHVNSVYGQVPAETVAALELEVANADAAYQEAEQAYERFIAESRVDSLQRQVNEKLALRDSLQKNRTELYTNLVGAQSTGASQMVAQQITAGLSRHRQLLVRRNQAERQLAQARALAEQLEAGGEGAAASSALALQLLKVQVFAGAPISETLPTALDLGISAQVTRQTAEEQLADVRSLVTTLESYLEQLDAELAASAEQLIAAPLAPLLEVLGSGAISDTAAAPAGADAGQSYLALLEVDPLVQQTSNGGAPDALAAAIAQLDVELQRLRAELAAEQGRERQLTQQRELAWNSYDALSNKLAEMKLARTGANSEVRMGAPATAPARAEPPMGLLLPAAAAGLAGLIFAVLVVFAATALGRKPFLARA
ncbi:MAG TPA: Wzz/FepE/Etk N-terminal domain-containing protein [Caldilineaceae bacterium]|nr:Wzz/FepE/Etk N-terminal domain-containing protein [Caldilineaceae bacterium]